VRGGKLGDFNGNKREVGGLRSVHNTKSYGTGCQENESEGMHREKKLGKRM